MIRRFRGRHNFRRDRVSLTKGRGSDAVFSRPVMGSSNKRIGDVDRFADFLIETMAHLRKSGDYLAEVRPEIVLPPDKSTISQLRAQLMYQPVGKDDWESHHVTFCQAYDGRVDSTKEGLEARRDYIDSFLRELGGSIGSSPDNGFLRVEPEQGKLRVYVSSLRGS
jgi:hypothetical protein